MAVTPFRRRVLSLAALGIALPAVLLAGLGVWLTFRIVRFIENDTVRYNTYLAQQVAGAFEVELMDHLRRSIGPAENASRDGSPLPAVIAAIASEGEEFGGAHFVPVDDLTGYSLIIVEGEPMIFAAGEGRRSRQYFCGLLLRLPDGNVRGAGGWWVDPGEFVRRHFDTVLRERLPADPRMYGGIELTRRASIEALDPNQQRLGRSREPGDARTARTEPMGGPFEALSVRVTIAPDSPAAWTGRFVALELTFIGAMGLMILIAIGIAYRDTVRQIELAGLKAGFVSNVTHELKTPISMIRLAVETLEMKRFQSPDEERKFLGIIDRETQRLAGLVDNILDFARLEAGRGAFRFDRVDLRAIAADTVETLKPRLDHLGFQVELDLPESIPLARADALAMQHCVLNLIDNAIKYSRQRRELKIAVAARDGFVTLSVADRGIGIAPGDRKRIFEKFVRLENGLVHDVRGAGLGLSLVDQIMRAHGGRIEVQSVVGEGSTFTLALPVAAPAEAAAAETRARTGT